MQKMVQIDVFSLWGLFRNVDLSETVIVFQMVDLHPKFEFLQSLSMIHARDVIKSSFKRSDQKTKTESYSKTITFFCFLW